MTWKYINEFKLKRKKEKNMYYMSSFYDGRLCQVFNKYINYFYVNVLLNLLSFQRSCRQAG